MCALNAARSSRPTAVRTGSGGAKADIIVDEKKVEEILGVPPEKVIDLMALLGDTVDNIPGAKGIGESATLEVRCGSKAYPAVKTDKSGSYRVVLAEKGKCSMTVKYKQQSESLDIASYDDPVQIDLVVGMKDGKLAVRRK